MPGNFKMIEFQVNQNKFQAAGIVYELKHSQTNSFVKVLGFFFLQIWQIYWKTRGQWLGRKVQIIQSQNSTKNDGQQWVNQNMSIMNFENISIPF